MRDSQRSRVYSWEREASFHDGPRLTLAECRNLVADVWRAYKPGLTPPTIKDGRGTRIAHGSWMEISLPRWARTKAIVLHEVAHSLDPAGAAHSPEFVALLIELLARWDGRVRAELRRSARAARVKVAPWNAIPKPRALTRAAKRLDRCRHRWLTGHSPKEEKVTREGLVRVYVATCTLCGKQIG